MNAPALSNSAIGNFQRGAQLAAAGQFAAARELLLLAAREGHAAALCQLAVIRHHGLGEPANAAAAMPMYMQAAEAGDAESAVRLAITHLHGRWLPSDPLQTAWLIAQAAVARHPQALRALTLLAARHTELLHIDSQWLLDICAGRQVMDAARLEALLLAQLSLPIPEFEILHQAPGVRCIDAVLTPAECEYLVQHARPQLRPALVINPHTRQLVEDPARNNRSAPLGTRGPDLSLALIEWRMARMAELPLSHAEYLAALCYRPNEEYRPHRDYLIPQVHPDQFAPQAAGQRVRTSCTYLNNVVGGGETAFPQLQLNVQPRLGRMLIFDNVDPQGEPEPRSLHAGRPVVAGEKWLATLWYRQRPLRVA